MKFRIPKRRAHMPEEAHLITLCNALDKSIPVLRTAFLVAGILAAGMGLNRAGDFLFVTGLLLQFSIWFENWWVVRHQR